MARPRRRGRRLRASSSCASMELRRASSPQHISTSLPPSAVCRIERRFVERLLRTMYRFGPSPDSAPTASTCQRGSRPRSARKTSRQQRTSLRSGARCLLPPRHPVRPPTGRTSLMIKGTHRCETRSFDTSTRCSISWLGDADHHLVHRLAKIHGATRCVGHSVVNLRAGARRRRTQSGEDVPATFRGDDGGSVTGHSSRSDACGYLRRVVRPVDRRKHSRLQRPLTA